MAAFYSILITVLLIILLSGYWKKPHKVINADVQEYYAYLPAVFVFHDISTLSVPFDYRKAYLWTSNSPIGKPVFKFTMGLSFLYAPFFFIAQGYSKLFGIHTMGTGPPYQFALLMSSFVFLIIGLFTLRKILKKYYSDGVVAITLLSMVIGTNLLYYAGVRAAISHAYSFALFTLFIWNVIQWYKQPTFKTSMILGLLAGIISLIRPSNALIVLFFIFYGVTDKKSLAHRIPLFFKNYQQILTFIFFTLLVWVPQMVYWKTMTGQLFYYSYGTKEGFFFNNPQIINSLFSYHNGWLLYTPIMILALVGIVPVYYRRKAFFWPILLFTIANIYLLSSWWCWWFVGFGNRAYIESYAILSIPFAEFVSFVVYNRQKIFRFIFYPLVLFLLFLNTFQVWQYSQNMGHSDGMTKESYWFLFLNNHPHGKHYRLMARPDYQKAIKGIYEFNKKK